MADFKVALVLNSGQENNTRRELFVQGNYNIQHIPEYTKLFGKNKQRNASLYWV